MRKHCQMYGPLAQALSCRACASLAAVKFTAARLLWCCLQGCDTFTFSPAVMEQLCCVPETMQAAADFEAAAAANGAEW
jgi:hypothetical protein